MYFLPLSTAVDMYFSLKGDIMAIIFTINSRIFIDEDEIETKDLEFSRKTVIVEDDQNLLHIDDYLSILFPSEIEGSEVEFETSYSELSEYDVDMSKSCYDSDFFTMEDFHSVLRKLNIKVPFSLPPEVLCMPSESLEEDMFKDMFAKSLQERRALNKKF